MLGDDGFLRKPAAHDPVRPEPAYLQDFVVSYTENQRPEDDFPLLLEALSGLKDDAGLFYLGVATANFDTAFAEQAYVEALKAGEIKSAVNLRSAVNLGILLARQPGRQAEAETLFRQAIDAGLAEAAYNLGVLLVEQPGRQAEAEAFYRQAIEAGDMGAAYNLRNLLARQPGRQAEGCKLLEWAELHDVPGAAETRQVLCEEI